MCYYRLPRDSTWRGRRLLGAFMRMEESTMNKHIDPIDRFTKVLKRATETDMHLPEAFTLATTSRDGRPAARVILLKGVDERGFVFYTNMDSRKARELDANPAATLCFWWPALGEQVRVEGNATPVSETEADEYFATRPRGSQLGAWVSRQSEPLASRDELVNAFAKAEKEYEGREIPRPKSWSGYVLQPDQIEFWENRDDRLHYRELFTRSGDAWDVELLYP